MSRVINPAGRNWKTEEKADYSTLATGCRCNPKSAYATSRLYGKCACTVLVDSQARVHCEAGI